MGCLGSRLGCGIAEPPDDAQPHFPADCTGGAQCGSWLGSVSWARFLAGRVSLALGSLAARIIVCRCARMRPQGVAVADLGVHVVGTRLGGDTGGVKESKSKVLFLCLTGRRNHLNATGKSRLLLLSFGRVGERE